MEFILFSRNEYIITSLVGYIFIFCGEVVNSTVGGNAEVGFEEHWARTSGAAIGAQEILIFIIDDNTSTYVHELMPAVADAIFVLHCHVTSYSHLGGFTCSWPVYSISSYSSWGELEISLKT